MSADTENATLGYKILALKIGVCLIEVATKTSLTIYCVENCTWTTGKQQHVRNGIVTSVKH